MGIEFLKVTSTIVSIPVDRRKWQRTCSLKFVDEAILRKNWGQRHESITKRRNLTEIDWPRRYLECEDLIMKMSGCLKSSELAPEIFEGSFFFHHRASHNRRFVLECGISVRGNIIS